MTQKTTLQIGSVTARLFAFEAAQGVSEYYVVLTTADTRESFDAQAGALQEAFDTLLRDRLTEAVPIFKRYYLSDITNQANALLARTDSSGCAVSLVGQPPLGGAKVAMWAYLMTGVETRMLPGGLFEVRHDGYRDLWMGCAYNKALNSEYQTRLLLNDYVMRLNEEGCTLAQNCVRTWFFVRDIDVNYGGVVKARNQVFATQNLTPETHFIASTGIGGMSPDPEIKVQMDALAIDGLQPGQIRHLYARTHLNPTYEYGVSFERGSYIDLADRRHVYISGTASINNKGEILHRGDVRSQTLRVWENVEALLAEADCTFDHVAEMTVYLRDIADYEVVRGLYEERFPDIPKVLVNAPVCRSGWLVEMECMAVRPLNA